ncbi:HAMP domain-containing histidine kinase [Rhodocytophaga rosea]|uniref:histidine kinase n=1 Tax=Rhodocytophaga rosea TaxID=2704465 RepID=A0A6C0GTP7_9BACT|nr:HAMP domain-containing sensor histidine kinase [Rhodocytophaga rosea]QHT70913.1 HAMP domain-containing histidine kinase [Rhodocytophaga rosea]
MKLLTKTSRIYLLFSLAIYLITGFAFYWIIRSVIYDEVESRLQVERQDFEAFMKDQESWSGSCYFVENKIDVLPVRQRAPITEEFKDTLIYNRYEANSDPFRQLTFYTTIGKLDYRVSIRKSLIESYKLIEVITLAMLTFLGLLLGSMFWFQRTLSGNLWRPFYDTLAKIKGFDLTSSKKIELAPEKITEFNELNEVLKKMSDKMQHDYRSLKEFTENASHEIQTPLSLINARVEQLIQSPELTSAQTYWIDEIYQASRRMSRLHQGLLLLAKIENKQFTDVEKLNFTELAISKLIDFEEILTIRQLKTFVVNEGPFIATISPSLADILLSNLLNNAIRHNQPGGQIQIKSTSGQLCVSNTGDKLKTEPERLFERFKKESTSADSLGLGLAIVKQICDNNQLQIQYTYVEGMHQMCLLKTELVPEPKSH